MNFFFLPFLIEYLLKQITAYNLQGSSASCRTRTKTLVAPILRTAPSTAILVQLTPLLGALVGVVATLLLVAVCIVIFIKFRSQRTDHTNTENNVTERDKGSSEPLSRNMGSHSSLDDKNPDVVPQENSEDEFTSEEKAFDRLKIDAQRCLYTPTMNMPPSPQSPNGFSRQYGELSLTTNPAFALYNTPIRRPPIYTAPPILSRSPSNIYTSVPPRHFSAYDTRTNAALNSAYGVTIPLLSKANGIITSTNVDEKS